MPTDGLTGRVALVTGGASGIGLAACERLAEAGAAVTVVDRHERAAQASAEKLQSQGWRADWTVADVCHAGQVEAAFDRCAGRFGSIDVVLAAAGLSSPGTIATGDPTGWAAVLDTNILGVMHTARSAFRAMDGRGGDLVVIGSVSGLESYSGEDIYVASKWAVTGVTEAIRHEARELGIRVTLIAPGLVDTPLARANPFAVGLLATQGVALDAQDVARTVVFAVSAPPHMALNHVTVRPMGQSL